MPSPISEEQEIGRLRKQRNLFSVLAICSVASIGFAFPRKIAAIRELKAVNSHLVELQAEIVQNQQQTRDVQSRILEVQKQIAKEESQ
jgi:uncharacterized protein YbbK (DUF523 family)